MFTVKVAICGSYHCIATRSGTCELWTNKKIGQQKRKALQDDNYFLVYVKCPNQVYTTAIGTNANWAIDITFTLKKKLLFRLKYSELLPLFH